MAPNQSNQRVLRSRVSELEFAMLGPIEVRANGVELDLGGTWTRWVLARLLLDANRPVAGERLLDLVGVDPSPSAMNTLMKSASWRVEKPAFQRMPAPEHEVPWG